MIGNRNKEDRDKIAKMDITPLIDVVFQLLLFQVIVVQMLLSEVDTQLNLPEVAFANPEAEKDRDRLIVNLDEAGNIYVTNARMSREELRQVLRDLARDQVGPDGFAERPVFIRGDAELNFGRVQEVMELCRDERIWRLSLKAKVPDEVRP